MRNLLAILAFCWLLLVQHAVAAERLKEVEGLPFSLEIQRQMEARLLAADGPQAFAAATVLPPQVSSIDLLQVSWPRKRQLLNLGIGLVGNLRGSPREQLYTVLAAAVGESPPRLIDVAGSPLPGSLNRLCIWPESGDDGGLVLLYCLAAAGESDSAVRAARVAVDGEIITIATSGALSTFGGFDVVDLDDNGSYELVTSRNLDGMPGGFSYHAVRELQPGGYVPNPEKYKAYFTAELAFLDWVVATREKIQGDPESYLNKKLYGFFYSAEFEGQSYGFDSIIELPLGDEAQLGLSAYNRARREAFERVREYRDQLRRWLDGGERPLIWKL